MITALLFDAGQVLYERPRRAPKLRAFLATLGLSDTLDAAGQASAAQLKEASWLGEVTPEEYHRGMLQLFGVRDEANFQRGQEVWADVWPDVDLLPGVAETLEELHNRGVKLGVVTNTLNRTQEKLSWFRARGMADEWWSAFATSCELGIVKPNPEIYRSALAELDVAADEAIFVGHAQHEIDGAATVGLSTIAFNRDDESVTADKVIDKFSDLLQVFGPSTTLELDTSTKL